MGLSINTNIAAFDATTHLEQTESALQKSMQKLSSGLRINSAADDAAGLAISNIMQAQIGGLAQAQQNAQDGISMVQTAGGALSTVQGILQRVRDLAVQYSNGIYSTTEQAAITAEVTQLCAQLTDLQSNTTFNGISLLNNTGVLATLQVGANGGETLGVKGVKLSTALGTAVSAFASLSSGTPNITAIDTAINAVSTAQGSFGAVQNRLEDATDYLSTYQENLMSANSSIEDVDFAQETTNLARLQILQQSGVAMLAQANQNPSTILALLGNG